MIIKELDFNQIDGTEVSVFSDISSRACAGFHIRNFFDSELLEVLKTIFLNYPRDYFKPYDGFDSLPRPLNFIFNTDKSDWGFECDYMYESLKEHGILKIFQEKISKIGGDTKLVFTSPGYPNSISRTWSALRKLEPNKGFFDIHCGRLFQGSNVFFYNYFRNIADVDIQMTFLMIVEKPECGVVSDIDIFEAHWEDVGEKLDEKTLKRNDGTLLPINDIPCNRVQLNVGDILIFDEGNYWHSVPKFEGDVSRISFGGFITKHKKDETVQFWV